MRGPSNKIFIRILFLRALDCFVIRNSINITVPDMVLFSLLSPRIMILNITIAVSSVLFIVIPVSCFSLLKIEKWTSETRAKPS